MTADAPGAAARATAPVRPWLRQDAFGSLLLLIVVSLILQGLRETVPGAGLAVGVVIVLGLLLVLRTTRVPVRTRPRDLAIGAVALALVAPAGVQDTERLGLFAASLLGAAIIALQIGLIVRRVMQHARVRLTTAAAVLCVYLLIGSFFANVYGMLASGPDEALFASGTDGTALERIYFSFITLTTTGYGDFAPGTDLARVTVVVQVLLGQLYLVTVVALVVGGLSRVRRGLPTPVEPPQDPGRNPFEE